VQTRREIADTTSTEAHKIQQSNVGKKKFRNQRRRFALQWGKQNGYLKARID
jgi:hypothetical protein